MAATSGDGGQRAYIKQSDVPRCSVQQALRIAKAIAENYASEPTAPLAVAQALDMKPTSSTFRVLCGASIAYGLTEGGYGAPTISLAPLGSRAVRPLREGDDQQAMREAFLKPRIIGEFLTKYNGSPLPKAEIALNILENLGVPRERGPEVLSVITEGAQSQGLTRTIKGATYVDLSRTKVPSVPDEDEGTREQEGEVADTGEAEKEGALGGGTPELGRAIFIAHGKKKKPVEQLKKILDRFNVPYKLAVEEPNLGRPIGTKVKEVMQECNCAILVFTADEELFNADGDPVWRPSENVVYELGAVSYLYDRRVVLLKENTVSFPASFRDLGYIEFEGDQLKAKATDVLAELIGFGILKVTT